MAFPTTPLLDPFTGGISGNWTANPWGVGSSGIVYAGSNQATGQAGTAYGESYWSAANYGPDCEAYVSIPTMPATDDEVALGLRIQNVGTGTATGYYVELNRLAGTDSVIVYRVTSGGVFTSIGSVSQEFSAGDRLGAEVTGTGATVSIKMYRYTGGAWAQLGSTISDTDAARITAAGRLSLTIQGNTARVDDFGGGTVANAYTDAGQGTLIGVGSGLDTLSASDAGQGTTAATGSGSDALSTTEAGEGLLSGVGSGSDALAVSDAGEGVAAGVGSGLDTLSAVDTGEGLSAAGGSGVDTLGMVEAGEGISAFEAGGADAFSGSGTDAGQGTIATEGAGLDTLSVLDAGEGLLIASGATSDTFAYAESGEGVLGATAGGLDVFVMAETGGGLMVAVGSGADAWGPVATGVPARLRFPSSVGTIAVPESVGAIKTPKSTGTVGG